MKTTRLLTLLALLMISAVSCNRPFALSENGTVNGHGYVDLGLPSGTLWATCNVGADTPDEKGEYFAWGETQPKKEYNWRNYKYSEKGGGYTKYNERDRLTELQIGDDAAAINWGGGWRTPTDNDWAELLNNTYREYIYDYPYCGIVFTGKNDETMYLPINNWYDGDYVIARKPAGRYWENTLSHAVLSRMPYYSDSDCEDAKCMDFTVTRDDKVECRFLDYSRYCGMGIRPVHSRK